MSSQPVETTLYSLSDEPPQPSERRDGERHLTLFRAGALVIGGHRELCLIRNISAGGMMLRLFTPVEVGQHVGVELKNGVPIAGSISWVKDGQVGIAFEQPIDVLEMLSSEEGPRPRMPRIETDAMMQVREGASTYRVRACDISQGGVKVEAATDLTVDAQVVISLPGLAPQPGVVRWVSGGLAGLSFNRPLALPELVGWLRSRREGGRTA